MKDRSAPVAGREWSVGERLSGQMGEADRSTEQLMAELQKLRSQGAEYERTIRNLRARRMAFDRLCGHVLDHVFFVDLAEDGFHFSTEISNGKTVSVEGLPAFLSATLVEEKSRLALQTGQPVQYEDVQQIPQGRRTWRVFLVPVSGEGGEEPFLIGSLLDVTEERRTQDTLQETEVLYHRLLDLLPDPVIFSDVEGKLLYVNTAGVRLMGAAGADELLGRSIWSLIPAEDHKQAREHLRRLRQGERADFIEQRLARLDGQVIPIEASSVPVQYRNRPAALTTVRDLTDRKRAAASERESRSLFYKIFHASPAGITITNLSDGRFVDVNEEWCKLTGYRQDEVLGRTIQELGLWTDSSLRERFMQAVREQDSAHDYEVEISTKQGQLRTVLCSAQSILVKGKPCVLTVLNDITERKHAERALVEAKERAEELARIKTAFLTNMTHEVRTPLTVILGFTSMLRQGVRKEYQRFVRVIERSGRRLLLMLDSILDLAQLEASTLEVSREPFNIVHVLQNVATELRPLAEEKGLSFELEIPGQPIYASIDHKIVTRVLNNLLDNAIKFTEEGHIQLGVEATEDRVIVRIRDTGIGIDQTFLPHVFEEFSQESTGLERTHQGSGLGLTVSKRLVEIIGGTIQVESRKGEGSLFTVNLPRADGSGLPLHGR